MKRFTLCFNSVLLVLMAIEGTMASTIAFENVVNYANGSFQGTVLVLSGGYNGYIFGTGSSPPNNDAMVICHQYGYAFGTVQYTTAPAISNLVLKDPECVWTESDIIDCPGSSIGIYSTSNWRYNAYSVYCDRPYFNVNSTLRVFGSSSTNGPLQYSSDNVNWHTFCSVGWTDEDAEAACAQLGYQKGANEFNAATTVTESSWAQDPNCEGDEVDLENCSTFTNQTTSICTSGSAAGATCTTAYDDKTFNFKHNQLFVDGRWTPICSMSMSSTERTNAGHDICKRSGYDSVKYAGSQTLEEGFTAYVRGVICSTLNDITLCAISTAPSGQGFTCEERLIVTCDEDDGSVWITLGINLGLRLGLPLVFFGGGFVLTFILYRMQERRKRQARERQQAGNGNMPAAGITSVGTTAPGYPLSYRGTNNSTPGAPPGSNNAAPPPSYNTVIDGQNPPPSVASRNQVAPIDSGYTGPSYSTKADYGSNAPVPDAAQYRLPPIQKPTY